MCSFKGVAEKVGGLHQGLRGPRSSLSSESESVLGGQLSGEHEEAWLLLVPVSPETAQHRPLPVPLLTHCAHACLEVTAQVPVPKR